MKCAEVMKRTVECLLEDDTVEEAARRMRDSNIGFLPVCDRDRRVVGTLTDRDIAIRVAAESLVAGECVVGSVMSGDVVSCRAEDELAEAEGLMGQHRKSRIVVVDGDGVIQGVISLSDIVGHESARRMSVTMREVISRELRL
jgi:CBS domain-containing protein